MSPHSQSHHKQSIRSCTNTAQQQGGGGGVLKATYYHSVSSNILVLKLSVLWDKNNSA
jgi:hypothetical protein